MFGNSLRGKLRVHALLAPHLVRGGAENSAWVCDFAGRRLFHAAREDTDLFPKLRSLVSSNEYDALAEEFEEKEHELFGEDGFDKMAHRVAELEQRIGIHDLGQFTPH